MHLFMYDGTYNLPPIELLEASSQVKFMRFPSSLGNSPAKKVKMSADIQRMYAGTYNRTCEAIALQVERLQIDEVAELLGQLSCNTQVNASKNTIHVCWDIQLTSELIVVQAEAGQLDEVAELLGQFTCTKVECQRNAQTHV